MRPEWRAIGLLHSLEFLSLNNSGFGGALPPALGQLPALKSLCLQGNAFEGGLPPELGQLGELRVLKVSHNQLVGPLPRQLGGLRALNVLHIDSSALVAAPTMLAVSSRSARRGKTLKQRCREKFFAQVKDQAVSSATQAAYNAYAPHRPMLMSFH